MESSIHVLSERICSILQIVYNIGLSLNDENIHLGEWLTTIDELN